MNRIFIKSTQIAVIAAVTSAVGMPRLNAATLLTSPAGFGDSGAAGSWSSAPVPSAGPRSTDFAAPIGTQPQMPVQPQAPVQQAPVQPQAENRSVNVTAPPTTSAPRANVSSSDREEEVVPRAPRSRGTMISSAPGSGPVAEARKVDPNAQQVTPMVTTPASIWSLEGKWGWYNRFYFRGLDVGKQVSPDNVNGGVSSTRLTIRHSRERDAFAFGVGYVQMLSRQLTRGDALALPPNAASTAQNDNENFRIPSKERYNELDFYASYSNDVLPGLLRASVGANHYRFSDPGFWEDSGGPNRASTEVFARADFLAIPYVTPSVSWYKDVHGFIGDYAEFRLDGGVNDLFRIGGKSVGVLPYVAVSHDWDYNGGDSGWNSLEYGVNVPVALNEFLTLNLTANYVQAMDDTVGRGASVDRVNEGFWGGVSLSAVWGNYSTIDESYYTEGKGGKAIEFHRDPPPWEFSTGAGWRSIGVDINNKPIAPYDVSGMFSRRRGGGALGLAQAGGPRVNYLNGYVGDNSYFLGGVNAGVTNFKIDGSDQVLGDTSSGRVILFNSERYNYSTSSQSNSTSASGTDEVIYPYVSASRELYRNGDFSIRGGLLYSYTRSQMDSGYQLSSLATAYESNDSYVFAYNLTDPLAGSGAVPVGVDTDTVFNANTNDVFFVVLDGDLHSAAHGQAFPGLTSASLNSLNADPKSAETNTLTELVKVAGFVRSDLDITAHDLAVPFTFRYDVGDRLHFDVGIAPTLTLANSEITTEVQYRELSNRRVRVSGDTSLTPNGGGFLQDPAIQGGRPFTLPNNNSGAGIGAGGVFAGPINAGGNIVTTAQPVQLAATQAATSGTAGKAGSVDSPTLPGRLLRRDIYRKSDNHALFGLSADAHMILDLNAEKTWFLDVWGKYHWIDEFSVSNGIGTANIDMSSWETGLALGFRF